MKKVAYLVSSNYEDVLRRCPQFLDERSHLAPYFAKQGAELVAVDWRDPKADWSVFDVLVPKAVWDYFHHGEEFAAFVRRFKSGGPRMVNPPEVVLWNMRKTYLKDLLDRGLNVGELTVIPQGSATDVAAWSKIYSSAPSVVVKPSVSAGGNNTIRCAPAGLAEHARLFERILKTSDILLQPFFPEIAETGEYSYFFFGGEFSHAIQKIPARGDYRAHQLFGGTNHGIKPSADEIDQALAFVRGSGFDCAYARVDGFMRGGKLHLVELELIEPHLYFEDADPAAGERFARAILS